MHHTYVLLPSPKKQHLCVIKWTFNQFSFSWCKGLTTFFPVFPPITTKKTISTLSRFLSLLLLYVFDIMSLFSEEYYSNKLLHGRYYTLPFHKAHFYLSYCTNSDQTHKVLRFSSNQKLSNEQTRQKQIMKQMLESDLWCFVGIKFISISCCICKYTQYNKEPYWYNSTNVLVLIVGLLSMLFHL